MEDYDVKTENKRGILLAAVLIVLSVVIVSLIAAVVFVKLNKGDEADGATEAERALNKTVKEEMIGWDGLVGDSTKALAFYNDINERLDTDINYTLEEADSDWETMFAEASSDLKFYLAIRYAYFVIEQYGDLNRAVGIMEQVDELKTGKEVYYYNTLRNVCEKAGDGEKASYYKQLLESIQSEGSEE